MHPPFGAVGAKRPPPVGRTLSSLRAVGAVLLGLTMLFFFEDLWALRNSLKRVVVEEFQEHVIDEFKEHVLGEELTPVPVSASVSALPRRAGGAGGAPSTSSTAPAVVSLSTHEPKEGADDLVDPPSPPPPSPRPPPSPFRPPPSPPPAQEPTVQQPDLVQLPHQGLGSGATVAAAPAAAPATAVPAAEEAADISLAEDVARFAYVAETPKTCAAKCRANNGTCNVDRGRCDCPLGWGGDDCGTNLIPACTPQGLLAKHLVPGCPIDEGVRPLGERQQGVSCECLRQCWALNVDMAPVWSCFDATGMQKLHGWAVAAEGESPVAVASQEMLHVPRVKVDLRQPESTPATPIDDKGWSPMSKCPEGCNGRGACVYGECQCHLNGGWGGPTCAEPVPAFCLNQCSGKGECRAGFCTCEADWYGADCSIPVDRAALRKVSDRKLHPAVYVYELPPRFNTWFLTRCRGGLTRAAERDGKFMEVHGRQKTALWLTERFLSCANRVHDPLKADYFFVPLWDVCDHVGRGREAYFQQAIQHLAKEFPYWSAAADRHMLVSAMDNGAAAFAGHPELSKAKWLVHWGLQGREVGRVCTDGAAPACYTPGKDVVLPPWIPHDGAHSTDHTGRSTFLQVMGTTKDPHKERVRRLYVDRQLETELHSSTPECPATQGVVQAVKRATVTRANSTYHAGTHANAHGVVVGWTSEADLDTADHLDGYATSVFCLSTAAAGWSQYTVLSVLYGCIPVIMQDNVTMPFEEDLPYNQFSIRIPAKDAANIMQTLDKISDAQIKQFQAALGCIWRRLVWSSVHGDYAGEDATEDAFATLLEVLEIHLSRDEVHLSVLDTSCEGPESKQVLVESGIVELPPSTAASQ